MNNTERPTSGRYLPLAVMGLCGVVLAIYWQVGKHAFIVLDDIQYVTENPVVLRGFARESVVRAFSTYYAANWHPLTWLSHMLDVQLFGLDAGWHHWINVLIHLLNTILLFLVFRGMTGALWRSAVVAALFGVHPLHIESVAWVAERKDLLSALFWLLTMAVYGWYCRQPNVRRYLAVAVCFSLGLMCKPMLVTLPFVLLLLDLWPLKRVIPPDVPEVVLFRPFAVPFLRLLAEKFPLLLLSAVSCVITVLAQGKAVQSLVDISVPMRVANTVVSYATYLSDMIWPASLAVYYPHPLTNGTGIPLWQIAGSAALLAGITAIVLRQVLRHPYLAVGWFWYLGTLVPVIGLVQVGEMARADRYTYIPLIGIFVALTWGGASLSRGWRLRWMMPGVAVSAIILLALAARDQAGYWRDSVTLFSRALAVTERNAMALQSLAGALIEIGEYDRGITYASRALEISPLDAEVLTNLGMAYARLGEPEKAISYYREALKIRPDYDLALNNLGVAYGMTGQHQRAIDIFNAALRVRPEYPGAWYNLGLAYDTINEIPRAVSCYQRALRLNPLNADGWNNLGVAFGRLGQLREAAESFREALRIRHDFIDAQRNLQLLGAPGP